MIIAVREAYDKPKFKHASELVHFHSFSSCRPFTSSITSGTHPPNTNILMSKNKVVFRVILAGDKLKIIFENLVSAVLQG